MAVPDEDTFSRYGCYQHGFCLSTLSKMRSCSLRDLRQIVCTVEHRTNRFHERPGCNVRRNRNTTGHGSEIIGCASSLGRIGLCNYIRGEHSILLCVCLYVVEVIIATKCPACLDSRQELLAK